MGYTVDRTRGLLSAASLVAFTWAVESPAAAQADGGRAVELSIEAGPLGDVLRTISVLTGTPVIFAEAEVAGHSSPAVYGAFEATDAVRAALANSGLVVITGKSGGLRIERPASAPVEEAAPEPVPVAPADTATGPGEEEADLRIDRVTITGTSLRGLAPDSSPLQVYARADILSSGVTTTEQFIRTLPQNFGGGSSEFVRSGFPNDANAAANNTSGSGANLRGLGSAATLTLVNGRRLAPSSQIGDFVDLSLIPVSAIERVEVLTDGASSIYGGDAVAGVINIVLREDFDGAETSVRYGAVTEGSLDEFRLGQSLGTSWRSGHLLGTYEYFNRDALRLSDRPGIGSFSQVNGQPTDTNRFFLLPESERHSLVLSARQELAPGLEVSATGFYSERSGFSSNAAFSAIITQSDTDSENLALGVGASYELGSSWLATLDTSFSRVRDNELLNIFSASTLQSLRIVDRRSSSDLWSADIKVDGELFRLPGGAVRAALGGHFRQETFFNEVPGLTVFRDGSRDIAAAYGEIFLPFVGSENRRAGIERLELNLSGRLDDYSDFGKSLNPKVGVLWAPAEGLLLRGSYSTSFAPPPLGRVGALDRAASIRNFGDLLDQFGVTASDPSLRELNIMKTFGTSADLEAEESRTFTAGIDFNAEAGRSSWSAKSTYYDIRFEGRLGRTPVPGNPVSTNLAPNLAFTDPGAFPAGAILFYPTPEEVAAILASLNESPDYQDGVTPFDSIGIINNVDMIRNLALVRTRGTDVGITYTYDSSAGILSAGLNANYIFEFSQQAAVTAASVEALNTLYNPADLQMTARLGLERGRFAGNLLINYKDSYRTDDTPSAVPVSAWTTVDLSARYGLDDLHTWLGGATLGVSALNLFDEAPPETPTFGNFNLPGFDPANASPLGRFVAVEFRKVF